MIVLSLPGQLLSEAALSQVLLRGVLSPVRVRLDFPSWPVVFLSLTAISNITYFIMSNVITWWHYFGACGLVNYNGWGNLEYFQISVL